MSNDQRAIDSMRGKRSNEILVEDIIQDLGTLQKRIREGEVDNPIMQKLRGVADEPSAIFEDLKSFINEYTKEDPSPRYLEKKLEMIRREASEIIDFGIKTRGE
ncbi:MAG: hypothetical protein AMQ74_01940 [Candidatus Methanofastidiosum methylothiophilum]|uniref:Uncharacterized protein n=1 Tax=Candidatus Methanofastidiosum methylothiophilum TaxID=1705564 RepID=A0A150IIR9_9EURY|nr:MAG: hypothetical protein AMQ74_01940 [Candidatus Methanofastidiosum methylthiophilus]